MPLRPDAAAKWLFLGFQLALGALCLDVARRQACGRGAVSLAGAHWLNVMLNLVLLALIALPRWLARRALTVLAAAARGSTARTMASL